MTGTQGSPLPDEKLDEIRARAESPFPDEAALDAIGDVLADMYGPMPGADWDKHASTFSMLLGHRAVVLSPRSVLRDLLDQLAAERADRERLLEAENARGNQVAHRLIDDLEEARAEVERLEGDRERLRAALQALTTVHERPAGRGKYVEHGLDDGDGFLRLHLIKDPCDFCAVLRDTEPGATPE